MQVLSHLKQATTSRECELCYMPGHLGDESKVPGSRNTILSGSFFSRALLLLSATILGHSKANSLHLAYTKLQQKGLENGNSF